MAWHQLFSTTGSLKGLFEIVPPDFRRSPCFTSIAEVSKVMPQRFFTRSNLKVIRVDGEGDTQKYLERKIPAGSVLKTKGTFTAKWKTQAETGVLKKKTQSWQLEEVRYLRCEDRDGVDVLVPLSHAGKFNAIYQRDKVSPQDVYSMKDILSDLHLPVKVRLLFGKAPVVPCIFTGMMNIRETSVAESVVCSTVLNARNVLFDLPTDTPVKVRRVSNDEPLKDMTSYADGRKLCQKYSGLFSSMIKLSPDLDTGQKVIMHMPSDPSVEKHQDDALRNLDLITNISLSGEPVDHLLDPGLDNVQDGDSKVKGAGSKVSEVIPVGGTICEMTEYSSIESQTFV